MDLFIPAILKLLPIIVVIVAIRVWWYFEFESKLTPYEKKLKKLRKEAIETISAFYCDYSGSIEELQNIIRNETGNDKLKLYVIDTSQVEKDEWEQYHDIYFDEIDEKMVGIVLAKTHSTGGLIPREVTKGIPVGIVDENDYMAYLKKKLYISDYFDFLKENSLVN